MAELSDAILGLIIAAIVSILTLTIKNIHGSKCWSRDVCCECPTGAAPAAVPAGTAAISTTEV
jgi:hypothetical protein